MTLLGVCALVAGARAAEQASDFVTHVQPIFVEHCYACHGPDKQEAGLRFDVRAAALKGGDSGHWFVRGNSGQSEIVRRVRAQDDERMPPPESGRKALSPAEIARIVAWIDQGANWPEAGSPQALHWSFRPIERPAPPEVANTAWLRSPLDRFVLARLEAQGVAPAPEADRYTLIKRLSYDLLGLPVDPDEADRFAADQAPDAYDRLVSRLLDSPHFGERWGRRWLDMARYADSDGYEKDNPRLDAWRYRDWVIDAINRDLPLDRFTIEQLAGDLLEGATAEQRLATAFHRQTLTNTEGGADQEQFRVEAIFDRVATTGSVWLGLTVGCAQCHSHKYDPITHQEFYKLFAFFNNADETEAEVPLVGTALTRWTNDTQTARAKLEKLEPKLVEARSALAAKLPAWEAELAACSNEPVAFHPVELLGASSAAGAELKLLSDGSYLVTGKNPQVDKLTIRAKSDVPRITGFRVEALAHDSLRGRGPGRAEHGNFVLSEFRAFAAAGEEFMPEHQLKFARALAEFSQDGFAAASAIDGKEPTGWAVAPQLGRDHAITFVASEPLDTASRPWLQLVISQNHGQQHTIGRFRVMAMTGNDPKSGIPREVRELLAVPAEKRTPDQARVVLDYLVAQDAKASELTDQVEKLRQRVAARPVMKARVLAERSGQRRQSHVLNRGDFLQPTEPVQPGTLAVLPPLTARAAQPDRLDLARWLVAPANPLTRRVLANQLWSGLMGRGIVRTATDFGVRGDRPTHQELLDWLAVELLERGWSRKEMIRLIVSSATYRQASRHRAELVEVDPATDWFARQNRFRVEGEIVRDLALAVGGLLSETIGGPSVFPPLPPDIAELSYANNFKWTNSTGEDKFRRGMYTFFKRTAPHPNLTTFDCPDANTTCVERRTSNTPLQALTTLNNEVFAEAAQAMARRALSLPAAGDRERLAGALRWCIVRPPGNDELQAFAELLAAARQWYAAHVSDAPAAVGAYGIQGIDAAEVAAWVATVRIMLNLDEFLTRE